jgi:hypothetical protein
MMVVENPKQEVKMVEEGRKRESSLLMACLFFSMFPASVSTAMDVEALTFPAPEWRVALIPLSRQSRTSSSASRVFPMMAILF